MPAQPSLCVWTRIISGHSSWVWCSQSFHDPDAEYITKTKWGFAQLLSHVTFKNPLHGYLIDDCFVVGAEFFVIKQSCNFESVSLVKSPYVSDATFTWTLDKFSCLNNEYYQSKVFSAGRKIWDLMVFPNRDSIEKDKSISIFLEPVDWESKVAVFTEYKICVIDQVSGKHLDHSVSCILIHLMINKMTYFCMHLLVENFITYGCGNCLA
ncbi:hypothetical protein UlMin_011652 [Ulmus minor]